jgi:hypothetical protein
VASGMRSDLLTDKDSRPEPSVSYGNGSLSRLPDQGRDLRWVHARLENRVATPFYDWYERAVFGFQMTVACYIYLLEHETNGLKGLPRPIAQRTVRAGEEGQRLFQKSNPLASIARWMKIESLKT